MKKLIIQTELAKKIKEKLDHIPTVDTMATLSKSGYKYIKRWPSKSGKGWNYLYPSDFLKPLLALKTLFQFKEEKFTKTYEENKIKESYGADKKTFAAHVLEYMSNKLKWDNIFSKKENREKYKKPVSQEEKIEAASKVNNDNLVKKDTAVAVKKEEKPITINRSLMRKVWEIYNPAKAKEAAAIDKKAVDSSGIPVDNFSTQGVNDGKDNIETGSGQLPAGSPAVRDGGSQSAGDLNVPGGGEANNARKPGGASDESGSGAGRDIRERRGRSAIKDVREQVKKLLSEKTDSEFTNEDKMLLRQYEGGGGLAEKEATAHGTLYEFYTPQKVVDKVWSLVDKYNPRTDKTVIEPSAGTGRFAENRLEKFAMFELDETSARIAGILHPDADITQGYFQNLFMSGNTPKKNYTGKKYDVAIGNPPYGAYSGKHKGLGEGKDHGRIEEYFIDRSLDTLNDGGILAMVVPSSFLRGGKNKAKEKIAGKATLLEAWRLPNGTFGTTGVGTDIIILRKEPGNIDAFTNNAYFDAHEDQIIGHETEKMGRFGMEKYVSLPDGATFDESLDQISVNKVPLVLPGDKEPMAQAMEDVSISAEEHENRSQAMMGNDNAAGSRGGTQVEQKGRRKKSSTDDYVRSIGKNMTAAEYNIKYGVQVDIGDMPIWAATDFSGRIEVAKLSDKDRERLKTSGNFTTDGYGNWYSIANYASGNIYEKLDNLEAQKDALGQKNYEFNKALLEAAKLPPKTAENIHFSPISDFAKEYTIETDDGNQIDLREAFRQWAQVRSYGSGRNAHHRWDADNSPISQFEIPQNISFNDVMAYIRQEPQRIDRATAKDLDSDTARMEAAKKREARRECAERLFNRFIREGMPEDQRKALIDTYNRRYHAMVNPDYAKIPVFIDGMNTHKGEKAFNLIPEQVGTISFMCNKGSGISAAEVGVGKTVMGESVVVNQVKTGRAKRPLVCVPKSVYSKWIKEFHQHFPDMVINELGNFSDKNIDRFKEGEDGLNIPEGTISVCTYEALQKITFKDETLDTTLIDDMMDSQTIYDAGTQEKRTARELAEEKQKMLEKLGKGAKSKEGAVFWENTGFDCITVDEIHNFKNVFGQARVHTQSAKTGENDKGNANEFKNLAGITPSNRAVKLFAITQLIQKQNNGMNVFGLSATPFTNSPIEVYNMLSLVARNKLKELGIYNMHEFLAQFAEIKTEWSVNSKGEIEEKEVMKNWKNLGALQNLINEYMYHVKADEAGVIRPRKRVHIPQLELSPLQKAIIAAETEYMTNADPKKDPGATLKAINNMRMATLSPAIVSPSKGWPKEFERLKPSEFVTSSPKLRFVCDSVSEAYKKMPDAGQIIYLPRGVNEFVHVKQYLMAKGMPESSIAFMSSATSLDEKERIKQSFNDPNGAIKVIIGSETIKEGVSLNGNSHSCYNTMLGWNPTETTQVEGRAWRQGNRQGHVHQIYPLMADSIDSLMYQKYDEKSSRIDEIWSYRGDVSGDVSDINPEALKFDLIKDPAKKANMIVGQKKEKVIADRRVEEARYEVLYKDRRNYEAAEESLPELQRDMETAEADLNKRREARDVAKKRVDELEKKKANHGEIQAAKIALDRAKWEVENATSYHRRERKAWKEAKDDVELYLAKFRKMGIRPNEIERKLKDISANIHALKEEEQAIADSYKIELEKATRELEAQRQSLPPLEQMIADNVKSIMGDLRPMDAVKKEIMAEREALRKSYPGKKLVLLIKRPKATK